MCMVWSTKWRQVGWSIYTQQSIVSNSCQISWQLLNDLYHRKYKIILLKPSMIKKNKYVSSLDLKMLGNRFMTIPESQIEKSNPISIHKARTYEFPLILPTTPYDENLSIQGDIIQA